MNVLFLEDGNQLTSKLKLNFSSTHSYYRSKINFRIDVNFLLWLKEPLQ